MRSALSTFAVAALVTAAWAAPPLDVGSEFQVNTYTTGPQTSPAVAVHDDGAFAVVWQSGSEYGGTEPDGSAIGVFLQRFDATGLAVGGEQQVNSFTRFGQYHADIAAQADGGFVVVWQNGCYGSSSYECAPDGSAGSIAGQRFDANGLPLGDEQVVNTFTTGADLLPHVAATSAGDFIVTWTSYNDGVPVPGRDSFGVSARRFGSDGAPAGDEFTVNLTTEGYQSRSDVAMDAAGNFVVVWQGYSDVTEPLLARRYDASGVALGDELLVSGASGVGHNPSVAAAADGRFVVAWEGDGIVARQFAADGSAGDEFRVNSRDTNHVSRPVVASDRAGNFVVAWNGHGYFAPPPDGDAGGVFAQAFAHDGAPLGSEFQVNTYTTGYQTDPDAAANGAGEFVIAWKSDLGYRYPAPPSQDGSSGGIFARRMALRPCGSSDQCDDANPCTADTCEGDVCLNRRQAGCCTTVFECEDDDNACTDDQCIDNACSHVAVPDCVPCAFEEGDCAPPDACTEGYCDCVAGQCPQGICVFEPDDTCCFTAADCDDGHTCTEDVCNGSAGCTSTVISGCVECTEDPECATGCQVAPETCDGGRCVSPEGCPTVEIDDAEPLGAAGALLIRIVVPENAPGQGKPKAIVTATIDTPGAGEAPPKRCSAGKRIGRVRTTLDPDGDTNLALELNKRGARCLVDDADGNLAFDVEVRVKRKTLALATVVESRTWRQ